MDSEKETQNLQSKSLWPARENHGSRLDSPHLFSLSQKSTHGISFKNFRVSLIFLLLFPICTGCTQAPVELQKKLYSVYSNDSFCVTDPVEVQGGVTKLLFVIDMSGSNSTNDSTGSKRANNIDQFVQKLSLRDESYQYGILLGGGSPINYDNNTAPIQARFTEDLSEVYQATQMIRANPTGGLNGALDPDFSATTAVIQGDIERFPNQRNSYIVFYISDGENDKATALQGAGQVMNIERSIYISTGFYGRNASSLLEEVAELGEGKFVNFENSQEWDLEGMLTNGKTDVVPWSLKEFLVYNLNAGFCLDGKVDADSDADGMCDRDEKEMNRIYAEELKSEGKSFDPANRFSFGDGYGDFFHWLRFKYPGKTLSPCTDRSDNDFDLLTVCEENEIENQTEEGILRGNPKSFDTDKDGIIDGIETFVYFASQNTGSATRYTAALDPENLQDNPDGEESVLVQIKEHRNPWSKDSGIAEAYDTTITSVNSHKNDCYEFSQSSLPVYETLEVKEGHTLPGLEHGAGENSVMVYYIQVLQSQPGEQGVLKHSVQKISQARSGVGLEVRQGTFSEYVPPTE